MMVPSLPLGRKSSKEKDAECSIVQSKHKKMMLTSEARQHNRSHLEARRRKFSNNIIG